MHTPINISTNNPLKKDDPCQKRDMSDKIANILQAQSLTEWNNFKKKVSVAVKYDGSNTLGNNLCLKLNENCFYLEMLN